MSAIPTLKSAQRGRVDTAYSYKLYSERQQLGHGQFCPAGAQNIHTDVYGRPVNQQTLDTRNANCGKYLHWGNVEDHLQRENMERPYLPDVAAGLRGGDLLSVGRDYMPQNVYGEGQRGNWHRIFKGKGPDFPHQQPPPQQAYYDRKILPFDNSMDAVISPLRL